MKYCISQNARYSFKYKTSDDYFIPSKEEAKNILETLIGKKASFEYTDWFGSTSTLNVWVESVECVQYAHSSYRFIVTLYSNCSIPDRFFPSLLQIAKQLDLAAPINYSIID